MAINYPVAYIWATYEDLIGEWTQTYFFLSTTVISIVVVVRSKRYRWFFALLAVACSYVFLEEISWGQRIIGFETPDFLTARNLQGEANLHNIFTGPYKSALKDFLSFGLAFGLIGYGLLYPLALTRNWRIAIWLDKIGIAAPPLVLWPFFTVAGVFELKPLSFNEAEVAELLVAMGLAITALHYLFVANRHALVVGGAAWNRNHSLVMSRWTINLMVAVLVVAALTTGTIYSSSASRARIDGRIDRGIEKFARRYERYGRCDIANQLYSRLLEKSPQRLSIMRSMAQCFQDLGQDEAFESYIAQAIDIDLRKYTARPESASTNRSLVRSYRIAGEVDKAEQHLAEALEIGFRRIAQRPDSASTAYSLGRTLSLAGRAREAFDQFAKAYEIDPASSKYRKAYFAARRIHQ